MVGRIMVGLLLGSDDVVSACSARARPWWGGNDCVPHMRQDYTRLFTDLLHDGLWTQNLGAVERSAWMTLPNQSTLLKRRRTCCPLKAASPAPLHCWYWTMWSPLDLQLLNFATRLEPPSRQQAHRDDTRPDAQGPLVPDETTSRNRPCSASATL
jgi:hypothetical protein